ncbi:hypothetical protein QR97_02055 [Streptomyces sp. PBH53]|nr:hypothetical protein QR97_02055 [Streptomyces sp. PBH53]
MIGSRQPGQWVSLGVLFGGFTAQEETFPSVDEPPQEPVLDTEVDEATAAQMQDAEATMRGAGYIPEEPYPGGRTIPWESTCADCGAPRRPTLQDVERGVRCKHIRGSR